MQYFEHNKLVSCQIIYILKGTVIKLYISQINITY